MKKLSCVLSVLGVMTLSSLATQFAKSDDEKTPTIKEVMQKLHKGPNAALAKLKKDLAADSLDWKDIQAKTNEFETFGAALPKNDPPKGKIDDWKKLADSYYDNVKKLNASAKEEDKDGVKTAFSKISNACAACHKAHRPN
jgi:cytochrome c556